MTYVYFWKFGGKNEDTNKLTSYHTKTAKGKHIHYIFIKVFKPTIPSFKFKKKKITAQSIGNIFLKTEKRIFFPEKSTYLLLQVFK